MPEPRFLRPVTDSDAPILRGDDLQDLGNAKVASAKRRAAAAMRAGSLPQWWQTEPLSIHEVGWMRDAAREAAKAWSDADAELSEVLNEIERTKRAGRVIATPREP